MKKLVKIFSVLMLMIGSFAFGQTKEQDKALNADYLTLKTEVDNVANDYANANSFVNEFTAGSKSANPIIVEILKEIYSNKNTDVSKYANGNTTVLFKKLVEELNNTKYSALSYDEKVEMLFGNPDTTYSKKGTIIRIIKIIIRIIDIIGDWI